MKLARRRFLHLTAGAAALPVFSGMASAQAYPTRPVRLIVGFPAGGVLDLFARLINGCRSASANLAQGHTEFIAR